MVKQLFIQPRHGNAPATGVGQVYLPTALFTAAARVNAAGGDVRCYDENLARVPDEVLASAQTVGIHTVGASLIPATIDLERRIKTLNPAATVVLGGQQMSSLDADPYHRPVRFQRLFGREAINGNFDDRLAAALRIDEQRLPQTEQVSIVPVLEQLDPEHLRAYLSAPSMSLYVAQGCNKGCGFCTAVRSRKHAEQTPLKNLAMLGESGCPATHRVREVYRDIDVTKRDLAYLMDKADEFGISAVCLYMSNLDICQTPEQLAAFAVAAQEVKQSYPRVQMKLTGLATTVEFRCMHEQYPSVLRAMKDAGLVNIGFGVEGLDREYLVKLKKGHNLPDDCYSVIRDAVEVYGFVPEILLTPGHACETAETLRATCEYADYMVAKYGDKIIIRPYAAKNAPGSDDWNQGTCETLVEKLLSNPALFQNLDFNAFQSTLVEPDPVRRQMVNAAYAHLCDLSNGAAPPLLPIEEGMSPLELDRIRAFNQGKYDH